MVKSGRGGGGGVGTVRGKDWRGGGWGGGGGGGGWRRGMTGDVTIHL